MVSVARQGLPPLPSRGGTELLFNGLVYGVLSVNSSNLELDSLDLCFWENRPSEKKRMHSMPSLHTSGKFHVWC